MTGTVRYRWAMSPQIKDTALRNDPRRCLIINGNGPGYRPTCVSQVDGRARVGWWLFFSSVLPPLLLPHLSACGATTTGWVQECGSGVVQASGAHGSCVAFFASSETFYGWWAETRRNKCTLSSEGATRMNRRTLFPHIKQCVSVRTERTTACARAATLNLLSYSGHACRGQHDQFEF